MMLLSVSDEEKFTLQVLYHFQVDIFWYIFISPLDTD